MSHSTSASPKLSGRPIVSLVAEDFGKGVDQVLVVISDRSHAKDLAIKEFDSFFWPENAGLRHPVILVDRKLSGSGFDGFGEKGLHRWLFNCAAGDGRNPVQKRIGAESLMVFRAAGG